MMMILFSVCFPRLDAVGIRIDNGSPDVRYLWLATYPLYAHVGSPLKLPTSFILFIGQ